MNKVTLFTNIEDGVSILKGYYVLESEVVNGEFASWLINSFDEAFEPEQDKFIAMCAIQKFRSLDDGFEEEECYEEVCSDTNLIPNSDGTMLENEYQEYEFALCPGQYVPDGIRVGYEVMNDDEFVSFHLDEGIVYSDTPKSEPI